MLTTPYFEGKLDSNLEPKESISYQTEEIQLDIVEQMYGKHIEFYFDRKTVDKLLEEDLYYSSEVKQRVSNIIMNQRRKYQYLFS